MASDVRTRVSPAAAAPISGRAMTIACLGLQ